MLKHQKKAHDAGWNDTVKGIVTADSTTITASVTKLTRIVQDAIKSGKATFYHYGIQDALNEHWLGRELNQVA